MQRIVTRFAFVVVALLLSSCAHMRANHNMDVWVDQPIDDVIAVWGAPTKTTRISTGTVYEWVREPGVCSIEREGKTFSLPLWRCRKAFITNQNGVLTFA